MSPLQSSFAITSARVPFRARAHCQGFRALLATSPVRVHSRPGSHPASVPSSGVLSLPTVYSALRLRGLFHPRAASRTLTRPFRGFSPRAGPPARRRGRSPMPLARLRSPASQPGGHGAPASTSRPCSARDRVLAARVIHPNGGRSPLRFSLLQALHLPDRARIPPGSSARGVPDDRSSLARWPTLPAHSGIRPSDRAPLSPAAPTCPSF